MLMHAYSMQDNISMQQYDKMRLAHTMRMSNSILNATNYMACAMLNGLKPRWIGLSHVQLSGQWMMKSKQQDTHKHAQCKGSKPMAQDTTLQEHGKDEIWHTMTHIPALKWHTKRLRIMQTTHTMHVGRLKYRN